MLVMIASKIKIFSFTTNLWNMNIYLYLSIVEVDKQSLYGIQILNNGKIKMFKDVMFVKEKEYLNFR